MGIWAIQMTIGQLALQQQVEIYSHIGKFRDIKGG